MTLSNLDAVHRLQGLGKTAALIAGERADLDPLGKTVEAARLLLCVLDGKTDHFPSCTLTVAVSQEEMEKARKMSEPVFDPSIPLHKDLADRFMSLTASEEWRWPERESGTFTQDEATDIFLASIYELCRYWATEGAWAEGPGEPPRCCDGVIFSTFAMMDGSQVGAPMIYTWMDDEDIDARPEVSTFPADCLQYELHETYMSRRPYPLPDGSNPLQLASDRVVSAVDIENVDAALAMLQNALGQKSGDVAGSHFSEFNDLQAHWAISSPEDRAALLRGYLKTEASYLRGDGPSP